MKILITAGGTEEPIDGVRSISNRSTGRTGAVLANRFAEEGNRVMLLRSARAVSPRTAADRAGGLEAPRPDPLSPGPADRIRSPGSPQPDTPPLGEETFVTFADLKIALQETLANDSWDAVVHLAAVSDYAVDTVEVDGRRFPPGGPGKIGAGKALVIRLKPTEKLLDSLRAWSDNERIIVVGFKLTDGADPDQASAQVAALFGRPGTVDYVVHNDLREMGDSGHTASIWSAAGIIAKTETKDEMAGELSRILAGR